MPLYDTLVLLSYLVVPVVVVTVLYWVIRTAVRDGILAAAARTATPLSVERAPDQRV